MHPRSCRPPGHLRIARHDRCLKRDDIRERGLRPFDLRRDDRLLADKAVEEPIGARHRHSGYRKVGESGHSTGVKLHRRSTHGQRRIRRGQWGGNERANLLSHDSEALLSFMPILESVRFLLQERPGLRAARLRCSAWWTPGCRSRACCRCSPSCRLPVTPAMYQRAVATNCQQAVGRYNSPAGFLPVHWRLRAAAACDRSLPYRSQKKRTHSGARSIVCSSCSPVSGFGHTKA